MGRIGVFVCLAAFQGFSNGGGQLVDVYYDILTNINKGAAMFQPVVESAEPQQQARGGGMVGGFSRPAESRTNIQLWQGGNLFPPEQSLFARKRSS